MPQDAKVTSASGHTKTNKNPALAALGDKLYLVYKSGSDNSIWYNYFDGVVWLEQDRKVTSASGHSKTNEGPAIAALGSRLYLVYKSGSNNEIWYNYFDGTSWLEQDLKVTSASGHSRTGYTPALAVYDGKLYLAYKSESNADIWYNTFNGITWLDQDMRVTKNGRVQTGRGPSLAAFKNALFLAYRDNS